MAARTSKAKSIEQEEYVAKLLGGRRTPSSGAADNDKGDIMTPENLIEAKYTENKSISIKRETWQKIHEEAYGRSRRPAMAIRLRDEKNLDLIVLSVHDYTELVERVRNLESVAQDATIAYGDPCFCLTCEVARGHVNL